MDGVLWFGTVGWAVLTLVAIAWHPRQVCIGLIFAAGMVALIRAGRELGVYTIEASVIANSFTPWVILLAIADLAWTRRRAHA